MKTRELRGALGLASWLSALALPGLASCGGPPPSMVSHAAAVSREVELFAEGDALAIHVHQVGGANIVLYDPMLEGNAVVVTAGVVSGGNEYPHAYYCFSVGVLAAPADWADRVGWREPDGAVVQASVVRGIAAHDAIASCTASDPEWRSRGSVSSR